MLLVVGVYREFVSLAKGLEKHQLKPRIKLREQGEYGSKFHSLTTEPKPKEYSKAFYLFIFFLQIRSYIYSHNK